MAFHINNNGEVGECKAQKGKCPFGLHYTTAEEAIYYADQINFTLSLRDRPEAVLEYFKIPYLALDRAEAIVKKEKKELPKIHTRPLKKKLNANGMSRARQLYMLYNNSFKGAIFKSKERKALENFCKVNDLTFEEVEEDYRLSWENEEIKDKNKILEDKITLITDVKDVKVRMEPYGVYLNTITPLDKSRNFRVNCDEFGRIIDSAIYDHADKRVYRIMAIEREVGDLSNNDYKLYTSFGKTIKYNKFYAEDLYILRDSNFDRGIYKDLVDEIPHRVSKY